MPGLVMGGGVGISGHGSHRIVCDSSRIAMPECGIGLIPDVGGSFLLSRAPGHLGEYLGMTGARMNSADAIFCGFADCHVPEQRWRDLKDLLCAEGDAEVIKPMVTQEEASGLAAIKPLADRIFCRPSAHDCHMALEKSQSGSQNASWVGDALNAIRRGCPLSLACTVELVRMAREVRSVREALALELRFTWRSMSEGDFIEGVRAQIIDKDRAPKWKTAKLEDVTRQQIETMLKPWDRLQQYEIHSASMT
jgi:enoyl-CoA hydratase/carnithine racemase